MKKWSLFLPKQKDSKAPDPNNKIAISRGVARADLHQSIQLRQDKAKKR